MPFSKQTQRFREQRKAERTRRREEARQQALVERRQEEARTQQREEARRQEALQAWQAVEADLAAAQARHEALLAHLRAEQQAERRQMERREQRRAAFLKMLQATNRQEEQAAAEAADKKAIAHKALLQARQAEAARADADETRRAAAQESRLAEQRAAAQKAEQREEQQAAARQIEQAEERRSEQQQAQRAAARQARRSEQQAAEQTAAQQEARRAERHTEEQYEAQRAAARQAQQEQQHAAEQAEAQRATRRATRQAEARAVEQHDAQRTAAHQERRAQQRTAEQTEAQHEARQAARQAEARALEQHEARRAAAQEEQRAQQRATEQAAVQRAAARQAQLDEQRTTAREARQAAQRTAERTAAARRHPLTPERDPLQDPIPSGTMSGALPWLRTNGNRIVTLAGAPITLRGISLLGLDSSPPDPVRGFAAGAGITEATLATLLDWGGNVIRLAINRNRVLYGSAGWSAWDYLAELDWIIQTAANRGAYTLLSLRRLDDESVFGTFEGDKPNVIAPQPDYDTIGMWRLLGERYADEPAVLFDLYTSPHGALPDDLTGFDTDWIRWTAWVQMMVADLRRMHPRALCFVSGLDWGADLSGFPVAGTGGEPIPNLVYTAHLVPRGNQPWPTLRALAQRYPVFVSEWGDQQATITWGEQTATLLRATGIGWSAAHWNGAAPLVRTVNGQALPTGFGAVVQRALALTTEPPLSSRSPLPAMFTR